MKKITILSLMFFVIVTVYSQEYIISFAGAGASNMFDSVIVENLTQNTSIIVPGNNHLRLNVLATGINSISDATKKPLYIYPNPSTDFSIVEFNLLKGGSTIIEIFDMTGNKVAQKKSNLEGGKQFCSVKGIGSGVFTVIVRANDYRYTGKIISQSISHGDIQISYIEKSASYNSNGATSLKSTNAEINMKYTAGDRLKFTGISGVYRTVIMDIPIESKTITFNFINCTDGDNNNYPIVTIGAQTWMAENLKYLPSVAGPAPGSETSSYYYVYGYDGTNVNDAKATSNYNTYGVLYNWPAAMNGEESSTTNPSRVQGVCPTGWHLPSDAEWTELENYLDDNGYNYDGTIDEGGIKIAKSLASSSGWNSSLNPGAVGNTDYPAYINKSGFTALPGGYRNYGGIFGGIGNYSFWWSSTESFTIDAYNRSMIYEISNVNNYVHNKGSGFSVRCVKD